MTEQATTQAQADSSDVPSASDYTAIPLRNRLKLDLDAPVSEVWALMGDLSRFPEYSAGLARVDAELDDEGRCVGFKPMDEGAEGAVSRDVMRWYEPGRGYLSAEHVGDSGTVGTVALMTVDPIDGGTRLTYDMHFDAEDLDGMRAHIDAVNVDMSERLIARFGGRVVERYVEGQ
jgi:hypothetical protein